jgi:uncharacterized protein YecE (DUF72 family)
MIDGLSDGIWKLATAVTTLFATAVGWLYARLVGRVDKVEDRVTELEKHSLTQADLDRLYEELRQIRQHLQDLAGRK